VYGKEILMFGGNSAKQDPVDKCIKERVMKGGIFQKVINSPK